MKNIVNDCLSCLTYFVLELESMHVLKLNKLICVVFDPKTVQYFYVLGFVWFGSYIPNGFSINVSSSCTLN